ncbi:energy transducer TonB [Candidatus Deferrimicrobium sp.]|uniref:energy transducer TonB n=1 Tax=Candidatus Deferrimicrobium sp. TaxID=3060586 RepID=UPI003C580A60
MPSRRRFLACMGLSVLLHLLVLWLAYRFPSTVRSPEEVMEIDLSDIPRATDFLPAERGVLEGRPPRPAPPPPARKEIPLPPVMQGRVPDLPVKQDLPPEESFPVNAQKAEPSGEAKGTQGKDAGGREAKAEPAPSPVTPRSAPSKSLRDLTPSLGKMVMAREEPSGGRGQGAAAGNAVGTGGKSTGEEGVTEEGGGGFRLTPLNAPEIQYISYFASIKRKIELVWQYPYEAAVAGIQGELAIDFVIARSGAVNSIDLVRGSGSKILDDEAIRAIRKAAPFDPIPAQYKIPSLQIRGRFVYIHGGALRLR